MNTDIDENINYKRALLAGMDMHYFKPLEDYIYDKLVELDMDHKLAREKAKEIAVSTFVFNVDDEYRKDSRINNSMIKTAVNDSNAESIYLHTHGIRFNANKSDEHYRAGIAFPPREWMHIHSDNVFNNFDKADNVFVFHCKAAQFDKSSIDKMPNSKSIIFAAGKHETVAVHNAKDRIVQYMINEDELKEKVETESPIGLFFMSAMLPYRATFVLKDEEGKTFIHDFQPMKITDTFPSREEIVLHVKEQMKDFRTKLKDANLKLEKKQDISDEQLDKIEKMCIDRMKSDKFMDFYNKHLLFFESYNQELKPLRTFIREHPDQIVNMDDRGFNLLHLAVTANDYEIIDHLIKAGIPLTANENYNHTALSLAIDKKDEVAVEKILTHKDSDKIINFRDVDGDSLLYKSLDGRISYPIFRMLIDRGANPHLVTNGGTSLLHCLSRYRIKNEEDMQNVEKIFAELIDNKGLDINAKDYSGNTCLHNAFNNPKMLSFLLSKGADYSILNRKDQKFLDIVDADGDNALHHAANNHDLIEVLVDKIGIDPNKANNKGETILHKSTNVTPDLLNFLIKKGTDINSLDNEGNTALHCIKNNDAIRHLVENGLDPNIKNSNGQTILHTSNNLDAKTLDYLLENGVKINDTTKKGNTFMHIVCGTWYNDNYLSENKNLIEIAIVNGADLNYKNIDGDTPLHKFAQCRSEEFSKNNIDLLELMIKNGANPLLANNNGKTALDIAKEKGNTVLAEYLEEYKKQYCRADKSQIEII